MMFLYFAEVEPVDLVLVEAGLGGREDSTNVFTPLLLICPSIGLDHQNILGDSYQAIAQEKAGAVKAGVPLIFAADRPEVEAVFLDKCRQMGSSVYQLGREFSLSDGLYQETSGFSLNDVQPGLPGQHQIRNAALSVKACRLLQPAFPLLTEEAIKQGLARSRWLGRTELIRSNLMIDGAHNNESIDALVDLMRTDYAGRKIEILFAAIAGKPVDSMLKKLSAIGRVTVTSFSYPNAVKLEAYPNPYAKVAHFSDWLAQIGEEETFYLITGSLYFISEVREALLKS